MQGPFVKGFFGADLPFFPFPRPGGAGGKWGSVRQGVAFFFYTIKNGLLRVVFWGGMWYNLLCISTESSRSVDRGHELI